MNRVDHVKRQLTFLSDLEDRVEGTDSRKRQRTSSSADNSEQQPGDIACLPSSPLNLRPGSVESTNRVWNVQAHEPLDNLEDEDNEDDKTVYYDSFENHDNEGSMTVNERRADNLNVQQQANQQHLANPALDSAR